MRKIPLLIVILCAVEFAWCQSPSRKTVDDFNKLKWLEGSWTRTNAKPGRSGIEEWRRSGDNELIGWGVNLKGTDTAFVEKFKLVIKDNAIYYAADVPENKGVVYFKVTGLTNSGFACENPAHDFPKKIEYKREGKKLTAVISGDGKSMDYIFERK
jgi:hypothetical protein